MTDKTSYFDGKHMMYYALGTGAIILAYVGYRVIKGSGKQNSIVKPNPKTNQQDAATKAATAAATLIRPQPTVNASGYPLKKGSRNGNVTTLQQALVNLGQNIVIDGIFGPKTEAALVAQTGSNQVASPADLQALVNESNQVYVPDLLKPIAPVCILADDPFMKGYTPTPYMAPDCQFKKYVDL